MKVWKTNGSLLMLQPEIILVLIRMLNIREFTEDTEIKALTIELLTAICRMLPIYVLRM